MTTTRFPAQKTTIISSRGGMRDHLCGPGGGPGTGEEQAVRAICAASGLDVDPSEVTIMIDRERPNGLQQVMVGGAAIGSYICGWRR